MKSFRFAAVAAVLLAFCLVFMMPAAAEGTTLPPAVDGVITLEEDVQLAETWNIEAGTTVTLDLAGHTITVDFASGSETNHIYAIDNKGTLTIKDSSDGKTGEIQSRGIYNYGTLTLESGTINATDSNGGLAVNNKDTATFVMNGGALFASSTDNYPAIALGVPAGTTVTLNGGEIRCLAKYRYAVQVTGGTLIVPKESSISVSGYHGSISINSGTVTINGGHFSANQYYALYVSDGAVIVNGGTFTTDNGSGTGNVVVIGNNVQGDGNPEGKPQATLNGGTFGTDEKPVSGIKIQLGKTVITGGKYGSVPVASPGTLRIIGGTFIGETDISSYIDSNYVKGTDGKVSLKSDVPAEAQIGNTKYATLADAVAAAKDDDTITVLKDCTVSEVIDITKPLRITDDGEYTITCSAEKLFRVFADADFENLNLENTASKGRCIDTRVGGITVNIKNCILTAEGTNSQPLTISCDEVPADGVVSTVTLSGTTIDAGDSGYSISTHVPVTLNVLASSKLSGYAALDLHDAADVTVTGSTLTGVNKHESADGWNSFGVIAIGAEDVHVTLVSGTVGYAKTENTAEEAIILFIKNNDNSCKGSSVTIKSGVKLEKNGDNAVFEINYDSQSESISVEEGVTSNFQIESKYLDTSNGKLACVATKTDANGVVTEYTVQAVSDKTVAPETPTATTDNDGNKVISTTENQETTIKKTGDSEVTIELPSISDYESDSTADAPKISIVISGGVSADGSVGEDVDEVTITGDVEIVAKYENLPAAVAESESQATVALELKIADVAGTLPVIDSSINDEVVNTVQQESEPTVTTTVLAMITALGEDRNDNLIDDADDTQKIKITFTVPASLIENLQNLVAYHVSADNGLTEAQMDEPVEDGDNYKITIYGEHFSSYVLVEEEPVTGEGEPVPPQTGCSAVDTGSGNYQYYPRDVPTNGIVDFGTSKVITGMELPAGSSGKVTLNTKPTFAMPENGFYAFEIDAPGYNLDAKINGGLSFQIPVADLEAAGWTAEDIVLFHGTVGEDGKIVWEALPTNLVKNENGVAYYKAAINGCSPFYIGFVKDGSVVNTEVVDPVTPPTEEPDVPGEDLPDIPGVQDEPEEPSSPAPILAVLAGLGAAVVLRRK